MRRTTGSCLITLVAGVLGGASFLLLLLALLSRAPNQEPFTNLIVALRSWGVFWGSLGCVSATALAFVEL